MKIIVFSDSHGRINALDKIYQCHSDAGYYVHLGDGYSDVCTMRSRYPDIKLSSVKGNTDFTSPENYSKILKIYGKNILCTHGHLVSVKLGLEQLRTYAKSVDANIVLFGHTHKPCYDFNEGIHYLNPGSAAESGYYQFGIIDITEQSVACTLSKIDSRI